MSTVLKEILKPKRENILRYFESGGKINRQNDRIERKIKENKQRV